MATGTNLQAHLNELSQAVWELAAISIALRDSSGVDSHQRADRRCPRHRRQRAGSSASSSSLSVRAAIAFSRVEPLALRGRPSPGTR